MDATLAWLLDPSDPAVRTKALLDIAGCARDDADVQAARKEMYLRGSVAKLVADLGDTPPDANVLYLPKYASPYHRVIALAEMGATVEEPRVARALDACLAGFAKPEGGFGRRGSHLCVTGNLVRAATLMGRGDDPRVRSGIEWLVSQQQKDGGWNCWPERNPFGLLDAWEALGAFAALAPGQRPKEVVARGVEFLLSKQLGLGEDYAPWRRLHFPRHYYYDILVGLDLATALGDAEDERLAVPLSWLASKRGADGTWRHEKHHPDIEDPDYTPYPAGMNLPLGPLVVEPEGPSKWLTLAALRVLDRVA